MRQTKVTSLSRKKKEECSDVFSFRCKGGKVKSCHKISKSISHLRFYVYIFKCCQFMTRIVQADPNGFPVRISQWCLTSPYLRITWSVSCFQFATQKSSVVIKTDWWVHLVESWLRNTTKRKPPFFLKVWYEEFRSHNHQHSCGYFSCCVIVYRLSASLTDSSEDMAVKPPNTHLPILTTVC